MLLGDLGADVVRLDRPGARPLRLDLRRDPVQRNKRSLVCDLKAEADRALAKQLAAKADVLIEGFRPGVLEKLGLGPEPLLAANPRLVFCRLTGFGQEGPLADVAGHDLTYLAYAGALHGLGRPGQPPQPPQNLVADYGGGSMLAVVGILAALFERGQSGRGQVVDAAMIDGVALLTQLVRGLLAAGLFQESRGENFLDGGVPFYDCYLAKDGEPVAVAPLEPQFYAILIDKLGLSAEEFPQEDPSTWPALRVRLTELFKTRTRDEWAKLFEGSDACVAPVLKLSEAPGHPHHRARGTFLTLDGIEQAAPAPRFSRTPLAPPAIPPQVETRDAVLRDWKI
jgi:alpha-methylacyl-CoA racemase